MYATSSNVGDFDLLERPLNRSRKRVTGTLELGPRGLFIVTETGERWVLDLEESLRPSVGQLVTAEGSPVGYDRLSVDWIGEA